MRTIINLELGDRILTMYRPFDDDTFEAFFENELITKISTLEEMYPAKYNPRIHDGMVAQLVRSEMLIEKYEYLLLNDAETETIIKLVKNERDNRNFLYRELAVSLRGMDQMKSSSEKEGATSLFDLKKSESD